MINARMNKLAEKFSGKRSRDIRGIKPALSGMLILIMALACFMCAIWGIMCIVRLIMVATSAG